MAYQLTPEDLKESLKQSGMPDQEIMAATAMSPSFWQRAGQAGMQGVEKFNQAIEQSGLPAAGAHILSMPLHIAANIGDIPGQISNYAFGTNVPRVSVPEGIDPVTYTKQAGLEESPTQRAAGTAGDLLSALLTGGATFKGASSALGLGETAPLSLRAGLGGALGAAESPRELRAVGAGIGAGLPAAAGITKAAIGKSAGAMLSEGKQAYNKIYDSIFDEAQMIAPNVKLRVPNSLQSISEDVKQIFQAAPGKQHASVQRFRNNPSLKNAHEAQSDLGKITRQLEAAQSKRNLTSTEQNAIMHARDLQKRIKGSIQLHFTNIGRPELAREYGAATQGYAKDVAPLNIKEVRKLLKGKAPAKDTKKAADTLLKSPAFRENEMAELLPGFKTRQMLSDIPTGAKVAGGMAALPLLYSTGMPGVGLLRKLLEEIGS